jgi:hypothetical protein
VCLQLLVTLSEWTFAARRSFVQRYLKPFVQRYLKPFVQWTFAEWT